MKSYDGVSWPQYLMLIFYMHANLQSWLPMKNYKYAHTLSAYDG